MKRCISQTIILLLGLAGFCQAAPVQWSINEEGNGHWYDVVSYPQDVSSEETALAIAAIGSEYAVIGQNGIGWHEARVIADSRGGYLAAIESQAENNFIFSLINNPIYWDGGAGPWFGGGQDLASSSYSEPAGGWVWIYDYQPGSFAPMTYNNWYTGEPSNTGGYENVTHFCTEGASLDPSPYWNDRPSNIPVKSFVIEYVPEPATLLLLGLGSLVLRKQKAGRR